MKRTNRAIELLEQDQAVYYVGQHSGHVLTHAQGREDASTWADYINVGMEHGSFDMAGLAEYMRGLVDGGPTNSGHRTPTVIVEAPVRGIDEAGVHANTWQVRQILARGVHGVLLCQAESRRCGARFRGSRPLSATRAGCRSGIADPARAHARRLHQRRLPHAAHAPCLVSARVASAPRRRHRPYGG